MKDLKIIISLLIVFLASCSSPSKNKDKSDYIIISINSKPMVNKKYLGTIVFNSKLDSFNIKNNNSRGTFLYLGQFKKQNDLKELQNMHKYLDTFGLTQKSEDTIYFDYFFDKTGDYYLDGYIEDIVILEDYYENGKSRIISDYTKFSHKVSVHK